jgi:hypothetical protein
MAPRTCSGRATGCASGSTSGSGYWNWSALAVQRHRNRLASDHLHEHAIAVHYDDPDVVLIRNNRRVPPNANGLTSPCCRQRPDRQARQAFRLRSTFGRDELRLLQIPAISGAHGQASHRQPNLFPGKGIQSVNWFTANESRSSVSTGGSVAGRRLVAQGGVSAMVGLVGPRSSQKHVIDRHRGAPQARPIRISSCWT